MARYETGGIRELARRQSQARAAKAGVELLDDGEGGLLLPEPIKSRGVIGYRLIPVEIKEGRLCRK